MDSRFYYSYFRSYEFIRHKLVPHVYGIRDGRSIDIDGMKSIEIPYTSLDEQRAIGDYLDYLDRLITLHQRKCKRRKNIYKNSRFKLNGKGRIAMAMMTVYHGGYQSVEKPEIRIGRNTKDFGNGFYCTVIKEQAERWARKYKTGVVSIYDVCCRKSGLILS